MIGSNVLYISLQSPTSTTCDKYDVLSYCIRCYRVGDTPIILKQIYQLIQSSILSEEELELEQPGELQNEGPELEEPSDLQINLVRLSASD